MKKSKSRQTWVKRHVDDVFVKRARMEGYRSRASYKLLEINEKFKLLKPGCCVVDLGAAPGGWSQVAVKYAGSRGRIIALDILYMPPIDGVEFLQGDFTEDTSYAAILHLLGDSAVDLVISDMAPNLSGMKQADQPKSIYLVELAVQLCDEILRQDGNLVSKCFEGAGITDVRLAYLARFKKVVNFKPRASRDKSSEIYIIGLGYKGRPKGRDRCRVINRASV